MHRDRPLHGGYPSLAQPNPLLSLMDKREWSAIEAAARSADEERAEFYRSKAGYGLKH